MFRVYFVVILAVMAGRAWAGYAGSSSGNDLGNGQGSSNGYGYGYSGSFSGGAPPNFAFPQFDFSQFLGNYLDSLNKYHQEFIKNIQDAAQGAPGGYGQPGGFSSFGGGGGGAFGGSFSGPGGSYFPYRSGSYGPSSGGASATASFGPGGIQQTAEVYPENPNSPNVNTRFGGSGQPGGFHSVFTSSQSHTENVNGRPQNVHRATTTVNDNGKITTYNTHNP